MNIIDLARELKKRVAPVYNLVGADSFLIKQSILNIKAVTIIDLEEFNFVRLDAEKMSRAEAEANLMTLPIGNQYRLVVFDNPNAEICKLIDNLDLSGSGVVVICVNASKLQSAVEIDCNKLDRAVVTKYITNNLTKNSLSIDERAMDYLIDASNMDMSKISNELNKLISYCEPNERIDLDLVTNMVANYTDYAAYMLTTAIDNKNYKEYQKILNEMTKTASYQDVFSYLGRYFRKMQYIVLNKDDEKLAKILNIKPYAIKMSRQSVAKNGINYYLDLYKKYIELDYRIKSGKITPSSALYELIF